MLEKEGAADERVGWRCLVVPCEDVAQRLMVLEIKQCMVDDRLRFSGFSPLVPCQQSHESAGAAVSKLMFTIQQGALIKTKPL